MSRTRSREEILAFLTETITRTAELPPGTLRPDTPLHRYGIDSMQAVSIAYEVEVWLDEPVPDGILADYETLNALADYLSTR